MLKPFDKPIYVTQPFLPDFEEFCTGLREIWDNKWLTNNGPVLQRYTSKIAAYFETNNVCLFNNGTLALQIGLQGMEISGEVITTPFTFVATTHALYWNKIRPVFVDIEPNYYTLDPPTVEAAITPWTTAILAVHVYGHPCHLNALADIARRHNLKLLYDAAHAFGVSVNGRSIAHFGDLSMFSFHATKLYHSIEGGMLTFHDPGLRQRFDYLKKFGFKNEVEVVMPGTDARMNEFQALEIYYGYRERLGKVPGIKLPAPFPEEVTYNYAYMPIEIDQEEFGLSRDALYEALKKYNVFARRYFYPLLNDFACYQSVSITDPLTSARTAAERILTLPIYRELTFSDMERICDIIQEIQRTKT